MGLADLKKKHNLHHQKKFTIDEFIEDADFYAKGKPKVVSLELSLHRDEALTALAFIERGEHLKPSYKKATFSLSTAAIDELGFIPDPQARGLRGLFGQEGGVVVDVAVPVGARSAMEGYLHHFDLPALLPEGAYLTGPGIKDHAFLSLPAIAPFQANHALFPLGFDAFLTCDDRIAGLPRSTIVRDA